MNCLGRTTCKVRVTSPALGSDDLSLDQSGTSIQILPEPNAVTRHVFYKITTLMRCISKCIEQKWVEMTQSIEDETKARDFSFHEWLAARERKSNSPRVLLIRLEWRNTPCLCLPWWMEFPMAWGIGKNLKWWVGNYSWVFRSSSMDLHSYTGGKISKNQTKRLLKLEFTT